MSNHRDVASSLSIFDLCILDLRAEAFPGLGSTTFSTSSCVSASSSKIDARDEYDPDMHHISQSLFFRYYYPALFSFSTLQSARQQFPICFHHSKNADQRTIRHQIHRSLSLRWRSPGEEPSSSHRFITHPMGLDVRLDCKESDQHPSMCSLRIDR